MSEGLVDLLDVGFRELNPLSARVRVSLPRVEDFDRQQSDVIVSPGLSVFLYRIEPNRTMRAAWSGVGATSGRVHVPIDLHYLLTPWADNARSEQLILGRAIQWLETHPALTGPLLRADAEAAPGEAVQLSIDDVSGDALVRMFEVLPVKYKVSVGYVARVVRIDAVDPRQDPRTVDVTSGLGAGAGAPR